MTDWFAMGDPQASFATVTEILGRHGILTETGRIRAGAGLVSMGDHFDYGPGSQTLAAVGAEGVRILEWLASHPPEQVVILAGNHDLSRVMELGRETDESFAHARELGARVLAAKGDERVALEDQFQSECPNIATPGLAVRDYATWTEGQRALVRDLLRSRRMRLGLHARTLEGTGVLATHAGVTTRETAILGATGPERIAKALNVLLAERTDAMQEVLDLKPIHVAGAGGREGGGLLYHRPAHPDRPTADKGWEFDPVAPRRFDPRRMPAGLTQIAGHSGHRKSLAELDHAGWVRDSARARSVGGLRTLRASGDAVAYEMGVHAPNPGEACLWMIDPEMSRVPAGEVELLRLGDVVQ